MNMQQIWNLFSLRMELQKFTMFPFVITFLLFLLVLLKQTFKTKTQNQNLQLPPGPSKLPFIGHLHHLLVGLPHHSLKSLAGIHGPLMHIRLGEISSVVISSAGMAKQMMTTHDLMFSDRASNLAIESITYGCQDLVIAPYGDYWRQMRKICILELLSAKRVESFCSVREEEVSKLVRQISFKAGSPVNLTREIFTLTTDIIARAAIGKACQTRDMFISVMKEQLELASGFGIHDIFPSLKFLEVISGIKSKLEKIFQETDKMLEDIITEHQMRTQDSEEEDLVDVLLKAQESRDLEVPITRDNVKAVLVDIFIAGTDTSSTTLEWTFSELLRNPGVMKKAQTEVRRIFGKKAKIDQADVNELNYLRLVIKESLRLHPPIPLLVPRQCRERCELGGYVIPKGTKVIVNGWAIGRDPELWSDPESFVPERFQDEDVDYKGTNFKYIPFGAGRRMCPGVSFGIANIELPLAQLLYHFDWKLPGEVKPEELDMTEKFGATGGRKNALYAIPNIYQP